SISMIILFFYICIVVVYLFFFFFFFQAEDGIRDGHVTGVQTCALPISLGDRHVLIADPAMSRVFALLERIAASELPVLITGETGVGKENAAFAVHHRSEERRVGKECRSRWSAGD